jgi:Uma2 family endonuclease
MTPPILPTRLLTFEEYLEFEQASSQRHEFVAGEVYAMSGPTRRHGRVVGNVFARLHAAARGGPCEAFVEAIMLQQEDLRGDASMLLSCPEVMLTLDQIYEGLAPLTVKEMEAIGYGAEGAPAIIAPV